MRRRPYSVVLLDEIEKAHTDVFNVLLQLLDDGRLTDGQGRTVDFRNTIVIMTSNLGSAVFGDASIGREKQKAAVLDDVRMTFRPEFVNRIDEIVVFDPLGRDEIRQIVDIQLGGLQRRLAERKLTVTLTDAARDYLANEGYDPAFGARPLEAADPARDPGPARHEAARRATSTTATRSRSTPATADSCSAADSRSRPFLLLVAKAPIL